MFMFVLVFILIRIVANVRFVSFVSGKLSDNSKTIEALKQNLAAVYVQSVTLG